MCLFLGGLMAGPQMGLKFSCAPHPNIHPSPMHGKLSQMKMKIFRQAIRSGGVGNSFFLYFFQSADTKEVVNLCLLLIYKACIYTRVLTIKL